MKTYHIAYIDHTVEYYSQVGISYKTETLQDAVAKFLDEHPKEHEMITAVLLLEYKKSKEDES